MTTSTNGKGSTRRGTDRESLRRFAEGWERAFGKKRRRKPRHHKR